MGFEVELEDLVGTAVVEGTMPASPVVEGREVVEEGEARLALGVEHSLLREGLGLVLASRALRRIALDLVSVGALSFLVIWLYQPLLERAGIPYAVAEAFPEETGLSRHQKLYAWMLQQEGIAAVLVGLRRVTDLKEAIAVGKAAT